MKKKYIEKYLRFINPDKDAVTELPLFLRIEAEQTPTKRHIHAFTELVIVLGGAGVHQADGTLSEICRGDIFVIPAGTVHSYTQADKLTLANTLFDLNKLPIPYLDLHLQAGFHTLFAPGTDAASGRRITPGFHIAPAELQKLEPLIENMASECLHFAPGRNFRLLASFMQLIGELVKLYPAENHPAPAPIPAYQLSSIIGFLNAEFRSPLTVADLLKKVPMSRSTLNRHFIRALGMTPMRYLNKLRTDHAAHLLESTALSVGEIAEQCGFSDGNYFARVFRELYGRSPSTYRLAIHTKSTAQAIPES